MKKKRKWPQVILEKKSCIKTIHVHVQQKQKKDEEWSAHIEIVFNDNSKKDFCVRSSVDEKKAYFGIATFWVVGKNCIMKNENYIAFLESRWINSYTGGLWQASVQSSNVLPVVGN